MMPTLLFACVLGGCKTVGESATLPDQYAAATREDWRSKAQRAHGSDLGMQPRYPRDRRITQGNGFRKAEGAAQRVLARILSRNRLPATTASIGVYACDRGKASARIGPRQIIICRSVLRAVRDEDALAFLIGHELAHILMKHDDASEASYVKEQDRTASTARGVGALAALVAGLATGGVGALAIVYGGALVHKAMEGAAVVDLGSRFSREAELEADRIGLQLMVEAGYNPSAAVPLTSSIVGASDAYETTAGEALSRKKEEAGPASIQTVIRGSTTAALTGRDLRSHPDAEARLTQLSALTDAYAEAANRQATPLVVRDELDELDRAMASGGWRDDPNLALMYAGQEFTEIGPATPGHEVRQAHMRALSHLERIAPGRRSEPINRNIMIHRAFLGDHRGSHEAAVEWWNAGGQHYHEAVDLLMLLGHDRLAQQAISFECRDRRAQQRQQQQQQHCFSFRERQTEMAAWRALRQSPETRLLAHIGSVL